MIARKASVIVLTGIVATASLTIGLFNQSQIRIIEDRIIQGKANEVEILAARTTLRLNDAAAILKATSDLENVRDAPDPEKVAIGLNGVPATSDLERREVAKSILNNYKDFLRVFFLTSNGDMYMMEPYTFQVELTRSNFADRDYYQGALEINDIYLSDVFVSAATSQNVAVISNPIYSETGELIGFWSGTLDLGTISRSLSQLDPGVNGQFVYVDKNGVKVAGSNLDNHDTLESYAHLKAFKDGLTGKSGHLIETMNGENMFISYHPAKALSNNWVILSIQPYEDALQPVISATNQSIAIVITMIVIGGIFVVYLNRSYGSISRLVGDLEKTNTQLKQKEEDLLKSNNDLVAAQRAKEEFITMISHELKTPLTPIKWYSEMLLKPTRSGDVVDTRQRKAAERLQSNAIRLESLIQDVLDVYKLDLEKMKISKANVDITQMIKEILSDAKSIVSEKQVNIETEILSKGTICCDPKRIEQVVLNLIKNSVDFVPNDGRGLITIRVKDADDHSLIFSIEDNGSGIPPDKADSLFQKFYQVDTSISRRHGGTGLGLAICKGIIESHRGRIWLDRTFRNGTCIKFTLPRDDSV